MSGPPGPHADPFSHIVPPRTPGPLGHNDAGDPNAYADLGPTPGPLGVNDHAVPDAGRPVHSPTRGSVMVADASADSTPSVDGWPTTLSWSQFPEIPNRPTDTKEDAQIATDLPPIAEITVEHDKKGFHLGKFTLTLSLKYRPMLAGQGSRVRRSAHTRAGSLGHRGLERPRNQPGIEIAAHRETGRVATGSRFHNALSRH